MAVNAALTYQHASPEQLSSDPPTLTPLLLVYNVTFAPPPLPDLCVAGTPDIVKALSVQASGGGKRKQSERVPVALRAP